MSEDLSLRPAGLPTVCGRCGDPARGLRFYDPDGPENPLCCWPCFRRYALGQAD